MQYITTFDSSSESLQDMLRSAGSGKTQLPDFQRGWVWDDQHVRSLLASISQSYPVGALMLLRMGGEVRFKLRPIEGVHLAGPVAAERLILDGQQRITSLYQALLLKAPVRTRDSRGTEIERWYYIDIARALDPQADREDAIVGIPRERVVRNFRNEVIADYSTTEHECAAELLPVSLVFDTTGLSNWQMHYLQQDPARMPERLQRWNRMVQEIIQPFQQYLLPVIVLRPETPKEAVCQVFEKVNTGGVSLSVFELLTATYAADDYALRDDWDARVRYWKPYPLLRGVENTDYLQAITLLATYHRRQAALRNGQVPSAAPGVSCKRKDVLRLTLDDYRAWADRAARGFAKAAQLLHGQKIFGARDLPYRTQLVPLAAIYAVLGEEAEAAGAAAMLRRWYWSGVFGELYGSATESRFALDVPQVVEWVRNGPEPLTVQDALFSPARLRSMRTRNSAAYKGLSALLLRAGGADFRTGQPVQDQLYFDEKVDIHHIFPQAWCRSHDIEPARCDSVVNKTPLAARTNRIIGGNAPSAYLPRMQQQASLGAVELDRILGTHLIDPVALRDDDFGAFFSAREQALLARIAAAMGKEIAPQAMDQVTLDPVDYEEEDDVA